MNQHIPLKKCLNYFIASLFLCLIISERSLAANKTFTGGTTWSAGTWTGGIPVNGDAVIIAANCTVDISTAIIVGLTVNSGITLTIANSAIADLSLNGPITVYTGGKIDNQGYFNLQGAVATNLFQLIGTATYIHNPRVAEEQIFINSTEDFAATSTLVIMKWFDEAIPLGSPSRISSSNLPNPNFGNVILNVPGVIWDQDGYFSIGSATFNRIKGDLTIIDTKVIFDDGTGLTNNLKLQNVTLKGNAIAVFQTGSSRLLNLTTNNFTDSSTLATDTSYIKYNSFGSLIWTVNGNLILAHNFTCIQGTMSEPTSAVITVNGNATFCNNSNTPNPTEINFIKQCASPLTLTVTGTTTIQSAAPGSLSKFRMIDGNNGALIFSTNNLNISGGINNSFIGTGDPSIPQATGSATVTVTNDFQVTGTSSTDIMNADLSVSKTSVNVGHDFIMNSATASLRIANSSGAATFKTVHDFTIGSSGLGGNFTGQVSAISTGIDTLSVGGNFLFNSATAANYMRANQGKGPTVLSCTGDFRVQNSGVAVGQGVYGVYGDKTQTGNLTMTVNGQYRQDAGRFNGIFDGLGNITFTSITQPFLINGGDFRGIYTPDTIGAGNATFSLQSMSFNGGTWMMHYGINITAATATLTMASHCAVNFAAATDKFMILGLPFIAPTNNTLLLSCTIGGNLSINGANGTFVSSNSGGDETINISQNFDIGAGINSFNITQNSGFTFGHSVAFNLTGNLTISGGTTFLSAEYGTLTASVIGNMTVTGGTFTMKGSGGFSPHSFNVNGNYVQSGGTVYLHNNTLTSTNIAVTVTFNSDFTQSGGTIYFDSNSNPASAPHVINILGANYNLSGNGSITSAAPGTGQVMGKINFSRAGTTNYSHSGTHDVQQVKQYVNTGTTLVVVGGGLQVASHLNNYTVLGFNDIFSVQFGGTLDLKTSQIFSNASAANSIVEIRGNARLRLQNINGLYDNTNSAAISNVGNMNYNLSAGSIVEYYGIANQTVTGIGLGIATLPQHKYFILDINLSAGYAHVSNLIDSVFVRSVLNMRSGELSLDYDHVSSNGGGKTVTIENPLTTAITALPGSFIRSETEDGSAKIKWKINTLAGAHIVPFGLDAALPGNNSLPVTYNNPAGTTGDVTFATYHTGNNNLPFPPTVSHLNDLGGTNNWQQTVDRFWNITVSGATPPAPTLIFTCTPTEKTGLIPAGTNLIAQKWMFPVLSWSYPIPGTLQTSLTAYSTQVTASAIQTGWWTLSSISSPLPVEFLDFSARCAGKDLKLNWKTASETNNDYFTIEKSSDGKAFEPFKTIKGAGNSSSYNNYEVTDQNPLKGVNYYRLSQTDYNGHSEIFNTISSGSCVSEDGELKLVVALDDESGTTLMITAPSREDFVIDVFDASGKRVLTQKNSVQEGFNNLDLFTKNLSSGIYIVKLSGNIHNVTQRFFINKNQ
jgi:hypothetical protein